MCKLVVLVFERQRQKNRHELEAIMVYLSSPRLHIKSLPQDQQTKSKI